MKIRKCLSVNKVSSNCLQHWWTTSICYRSYCSKTSCRKLHCILPLSVICEHPAARCNMQQSKQRNLCSPNCTVYPTQPLALVGKQSCQQTANLAQLCTLQLNPTPAANTNISVSQMCYCSQSSINATCDRLTRFDFGTWMLSSSSELSDELSSSSFLCLLPGFVAACEALRLGTCRRTRVEALISSKSSTSANKSPYLHNQQYIHTHTSPEKSNCRYLIEIQWI